MEAVCILYGPLVFYGSFIYFVVIWYIILYFGIFSPVLVCYTKTNLATLEANVAPSIEQMSSM
jgi:hypothetical protein